MSSKKSKNERTARGHMLGRLFLRNSVKNRGKTGKKRLETPKNAKKSARHFYQSHRADLAGVARFELTNEGVKVPCLTAWLYPYIQFQNILP